MTFFLFVGFILFRISLVFFTQNWLLIWVWLECVTYSLVILLQSRLLTPRSSEALVKYFLIQAIARLLILFGIVVRFRERKTLALWGEYNNFCYFFLLVGLFTKLAVFPNPYWFVDVVRGLELSKSFFVVIISKISPFYLFFCLSDYNYFWFFFLVGGISVVVGSLMGVNQTRVRKIIAYSSIAKVGWFTVCSPFLGGKIVFYCLLGYLFSVWAFLWVSSVFSFDSMISSIRFSRKGWEIFLILFSLLSLGGLPPLLGFFIKWQLFQGLVLKSLYWVVIFLIFRRLVSLYFYLRVFYSVYSLEWARLKYLSLSWGESFNLALGLGIFRLIFFGPLGVWLVGSLLGGL